MRILLALLVITLVGCATQPIPMPIPERCVNVPGKGCQPITAGNVGGTTLGHHNDEDIPAKAATVKP